MYKTLCIAFVIFCYSNAFSQTSVQLSWATLQDIEFKSKYVKEIEGDMFFPSFPSNILQLKGKKVTVKGFCVPVEKDGKTLALSANSYANCYFCGKSGPASVLTVKLKNPKPYKLDAYISFTGILKLNDNDIREFYYILEDAVETN